jgi:hypothetical protein
MALHVRLDCADEPYETADLNVARFNQGSRRCVFDPTRDGDTGTVNRYGDWLSDRLADALDGRIITNVGGNGDEVFAKFV